MFDGKIPAAIGNWHLVFLHLPIGFVVAAVVLEAMLWRRPSAAGRALLSGLLAVNAVASLVAAGLGLLLAEGGGYDAEELARHRWAGVAAAGFAVLAWWLQARALRQADGEAPPGAAGEPSRPVAIGSRGPDAALGLARTGLLALVAATTVAGHFGATLTHGESALAFWRDAPPPPSTTARAAVPSAAAAGAGSSSSVEGAASALPADHAAFASVVQPILQRACYDCHGDGRSKGRLRLDSRAAAERGGKSGQPALVAGDAAASELIRRVKLPRDAKGAMPPDDEPALTAAEVAALERWIESGAGGW